MNSTAVHSSIVSEAYSSRRVARFENHPAMPALLKELPPRSVASLFQEIGIADAGVLMAMMPTRALLLTLDESIWKSAKPHLPETISVADLLDWLEAWSEIGEKFLIEKLNAMNEDYLTTLLSRVVKVESLSRYAVYGEHFDAFVELCEDDRERFGPYIAESMVADGADVVREVVHAMWSSDAPKFMRIFGRLADLPDPVDSTRGSTATFHDVEFDRKSFREAQGFVTAEGARAFFAYADQLTRTEIMALDQYDAETRRYLDAIARAAEQPDATSSPVIADDLEDDESAAMTSTSVRVIGPETNTSLRMLLESSQLLPKQNATPLLQDARRSRELKLRAELRRLADENIESFHARARELGYVANLLRWQAIDTDALSDNDAKDAAFATCNLGLELAVDPRAVEFEREPGLIRSFLFGWNALTSIRGRVIGAFAGALTRELTLAPWLRSEATTGLADLRRAVESRQFEAAREATIFLSIVFDSKVCHAIAPLLSAIPRFSTLLDGATDSTQPRWIATKADFLTLQRLLDSLRLKSERPK